MSADVQQAPSLSEDKGSSRTNRDPLHRRPSVHLLHRKHKGEDIKQCRICRKRNQRFIHQDKYGGGPPLKRRKKGILIPPTKFLLGGNSRDPLNLNSLRDEEVNRRLNAVTPETSPMPTPQWKKGEVEVLLPPNIHDPLNLEGSQSPLIYVSTPSLRKNRKKHKKKKHRPSNEQLPIKPDLCEEGCNEGSSTEAISCNTNQPEITLNTSGSDCGAPDDHQQDESTTCTECTTLPVEPNQPVPDAPVAADDGQIVKVVPVVLPQPVQTQPVVPPVPPNSLPLSKLLDPSLPGKKAKGINSKKIVDKIVSPVVKQPGACGTSGPRRKPPQPSSKNKSQTMPNFKESNKKYQYGNYNRYYGYRNADYDSDPRLRLLESRRDLFVGKEVLDIGCNTGHVTLAVATDLGARRVVGLDLDRNLIEAAKGNIKHYLRRGNTGQSYPISMPLLYGPLPDTKSDSVPAPVSDTFPHNISFVQGNYVPTSDVVVDLETPQFDTILCLSVTKWFHLNWGDEGLKRAFRRMYAQLRPGGTLILEPQPWPSYKRKKNITETTWKNYQCIQLFPQKFTQFLLSEVGFTKCEILGSPAHSSRGFQRPIKIYTKGLQQRTSLIKDEISSCSETVKDSRTSEAISETSEAVLPVTVLSDNSEIKNVTLNTYASENIQDNN